MHSPTHLYMQSAPSYCYCWGRPSVATVLHHHSLLWQANTLQVCVTAQETLLDFNIAS